MKENSPRLQTPVLATVLPSEAAFARESDLIPALAKNPEQHQKKVDEIEVEGEGT
jgi:hypothetical protein